MTPRRIVGMLAELAMLVLTVVVTVGLERLFLDTSFLGELLAMVVAAHALAIVVRRAGFGMIVAAMVSLAGLLVVGNLLLFPETSASLIPTRETLSLLRVDLSDAWTLFTEESAPVEPIRGFVAVSGAALWWGVFLADWAAFRLRSPLEAIAPATAVFVFAALLGAEQNQVAHGVTYAAAVAGVLLTMRADRQTREEVWVASGTGRGVSTTVRVGTVIASIAVVFGALAGPALPGAGDVLLDPSEWDNGPEARQVISPLVEVNATLVEQSNFEMFSVKVDDPSEGKSYWRLMALTDFDGQLWRRSSNFEDARGEVATDVGEGVLRRPLRQEIKTRSLGGIYLPAAYEVSEVIDSQSVELEYETATGALVVKRDSEERAAAGFTYVIESQIPDYDPASLPADATAGLDREFIEEHTTLPPGCDSGGEPGRCWPSSVTELAHEITDGFDTDYEKVRALQDYFLDPDLFTYDLEVALRHDVSDIEDFVHVVRRGYCEQFASTFASMARSIGIPSRVAVGFTWGEWSESRQEYVVKGEHAHAWPEVYFAGVGWVVLDPTPGRAPAHGSAITGLAPAQLYENDERNRGGEPVEAPPVTTPPLDVPGNQLPFFGEDVTTPTTVPVTGGAGEAASGFPWGVVLRALVVLAVVAALLGSVPMLRYLLRQRRLHRVAADPIGRVELAWDDALDALALHGIRQAPHETLREFVRRSLRSGLPLGPLDVLASEVSLVRYARLPDPIPHAVSAQLAAEEIVDTCRSSRTFTELFMMAIDPRTLRVN